MKAGWRAAVPSLCLALALLATFRPASRAGATAEASAFRSVAGLTVVSAKQDGPRLWHLSVRTAALSRPVDVNVLLPVHYAANARRYPTLYLEHGTSGRASDWLEQGDVTAATARFPLIVVMPDAGYD